MSLEALEVQSESLSPVSLNGHVGQMNTRRVSRAMPDPQIGSVSVPHRPVTLLELPLQPSLSSGSTDMA